MLTEAALLLESLPLTTSEFGSATSRLNNARRYLESNVMCVELSKRGQGGDFPCDDQKAFGVPVVEESGRSGRTSRQLPSHEALCIRVAWQWKLLSLA
jgi:hypothetical protein